MLLMAVVPIADTQSNMLDAQNPTRLSYIPMPRITDVRPEHGDKLRLLQHLLDHPEDRFAEGVNKHVTQPSPKWRVQVNLLTHTQGGVAQIIQM